MVETGERSLCTRIEETFWTRHANPKSGWSRTLLGPMLLVALYRRDWRILALTVVFTVVIRFYSADPTPTRRAG